MEHLHRLELLDMYRQQLHQARSEQLQVRLRQMIAELERQVS